MNPARYRCVMSHTTYELSTDSIDYTSISEMVHDEAKVTADLFCFNDLTSLSASMPMWGLNKNKKKVTNSRELWRAKEKQCTRIIVMTTYLTKMQLKSIQ